MAHKPQQTEFKFSAIIGFPGTGYESVINGLKLAGIPAQAGDSWGYRDASEFADSWLYDVQYLHGKLAQKSETLTRTNWLSFGGSNAHMLLTLPWRQVIVLVPPPADELRRRMNAFRKKVQLDPFTEERFSQVWKEVLTQVELLRQYALLSGSHVSFVNAGSSLSRVIDKCLTVVNEVENWANFDKPFGTDSPWEELDHSLKDLLPSNPIGSRKICLLATNGCGKSWITRELRKKGYNSVSGDALSKALSGYVKGDDPMSFNGEVNWDVLKTKKVLLPQSVLEHLDIYSGFVGNFENEKDFNILTVGILPNPFKLRVALRERNTLEMGWHNGESRRSNKIAGHGTSFLEAVEIASKADIILPYDYSPERILATLEKLMNNNL